MIQASFPTITVSRSTHAARPWATLHHGPHLYERRGSRRYAAGRHPGREGAAGLGLRLHTPLLGTLPDEFTEYETIHPRIDRQRNVAIMPWGTEIPLDPFFGIIATAPPPAWGRCGSPVPRAFGGNMDNKELRAGTTL